MCVCSVSHEDRVGQNRTWEARSAGWTDTAHSDRVLSDYGLGAYQAGS